MLFDALLKSRSVDAGLLDDFSGRLREKQRALAE